MIVSDIGDQLVIVRQVDHQDQCAAMARAWGAERFILPAHRRSLVTAAALHDEGWREWERAPSVGADGRPIDFPDLDRAEHVSLYRSGIDTVCDRDPRAGLLVSMHGTGLYRARLGLDHVVSGSGTRRPPEVERFLAHEDARQATLRAELGPGEELDRWAWASYRLLQAWDLLSLALTWGRLRRRDAITLARVPRDEDDRIGVELTVRPRGDWSAGLSPWPFSARRHRFAVSARRIASRPFADAGALREALDRAPVELLECDLVPG